MKILVLGGTKFFGIPMIKALLNYGHDITIATRGHQPIPFESKVKHIKMDRQNQEDLKSLFSNAHYDLVIDKIAYSSNDIKKLLDVISCDRYMLMSSTAVYEYCDSFDPYHDEFKYVNRYDDEYRVTKRYAECALAQDYPHIPSVVVRYPFVVGMDDYTKRIQFYIEHILYEKPMYIDNLDTPLSFIDSQEAGEFMAFLANENIIGIFDGASFGSITTKQIIGIIENLTNKKAILSKDGDKAPYNDTPEFKINTQPAQELGYYFSDLSDWFESLIKQLLIEKNNNFYKIYDDNYIHFSMINNYPCIDKIVGNNINLLLDSLSEDYHGYSIVMEANHPLLQSLLQNHHRIVGGYTINQSYYHILTK